MVYKENRTLIFLLLILSTAAIMRFWAFPDIPFMHDELSAMSRVQFQSFSDMIRYGVVLNDTHPAGIQVFLYYWVRLGGESEWWVKLPFLLSGVASVYLIFLIGRIWFDEITGLLTASYMATLQFFIMYSQIARPYSSGLFLTLLMVYFWSKYFFGQPKNRYLILYVLFSAMSAYNHHFSLLFAGLVGISGLLFVKKNQLLKYFLAGLGIFVLYIPHLSVFFHQLEQGGIGGVGGWLSAPTPEFISNFFSWVMHFSWVAAGLLLVVVLFILLKSGKLNQVALPRHKRALLLFWFVVPFALGYFYSTLVNPILQFSLLIFTTPYLIMFVFSWHKTLKTKQLAVVLLLVISVNSLTLIFGRHYYKDFYSQPYEDLFKTALVDQGNREVFIIDDCIPYIHGYYFRKFGKELPYYTKRNREFYWDDFNKMLSRIKQPIVVVEALTGEELQWVRSYFPYELDYRHGFTHEIYVLSKNPADRDSENSKTLVLFNQDTLIGTLRIKPELVVFDSVLQRKQLIMTAYQEWGFSTSFVLDSISKSGYVILEASLGVTPLDSLGSALLTGYVTRGEKVIFWLASPFRRFEFDNHQPITVFLTIDMQSALHNHLDTDDVKIHFKIWNNKKQGSYIIDWMKINLHKGNPERYSLYYR